MKKIYLSLFIAIALALSTKNSFGKAIHVKVKKQLHVSSKLARTNLLKTLSSSNTKKLSNALSASKYTNRLSSQIITVNDTESLPPVNNRIHSLIAPHGNESIDDSASEASPHHFVSVQGVINSSLTSAGQDAGLSNELIMQLTNIFAWDIDFASNLQHGDQFTVVYEKSNVTTGKILAAEFVTGGKTYTAIRYKDREGQVNYFTPEGKPLRKAFLSAPVDFIRISSGYDVHRKHPILNRIRAHKGVDYAARTGTPVRAAGNGKVIFLGRKGGYGQVMILEHGEHYETLYAHLSDFKKGLQNGDQVEQGQVIGYVGQTGLATGPHLHYEFRVDGVHRNPDTLNNQHTLPLSDNRLAEFKSQSRSLLAQLYQAKARNLLAKTGMTLN